MAFFGVGGEILVSVDVLRARQRLCLKYDDVSYMKTTLRRRTETPRGLLIGNEAIPQRSSGLTATAVNDSEEDNE